MGIAEQTEAMENKKSGRINKFQPKCGDFCTGLGWGGSRAPCALRALKSKESCLFPGPFFTGELCHRNSTSGEITDIPCCNLEAAPAVGDYNIGKATTCVIGKQCNCKKFGKVDKKDRQAKEKACSRLRSAPQERREPESASSHRNFSVHPKAHPVVVMGKLQHNGVVKSRGSKKNLFCRKRSSPRNECASLRCTAPDKVRLIYASPPRRSTKQYKVSHATQRSQAWRQSL